MSLSKMNFQKMQIQMYYYCQGLSLGVSGEEGSEKEEEEDETKREKEEVSGLEEGEGMGKKYGKRKPFAPTLSEKRFLARCSELGKIIVKSSR